MRRVSCPPLRILQILHMGKQSKIHLDVALFLNGVWHGFLRYNTKTNDWTAAPVCFQMEKTRVQVDFNIRHPLNFNFGSKQSYQIGQDHVWHCFANVLPSDGCGMLNVKEPIDKVGRHAAVGDGDRRDAAPLHRCVNQGNANDSVPPGIIIHTIG